MIKIMNMFDILMNLQSKGQVIMTQDVPIDENQRDLKSGLQRHFYVCPVNGLYNAHQLNRYAGELLSSKPISSCPFTQDNDFLYLGQSKYESRILKDGFLAILLDMTNLARLYPKRSYEPTPAHAVIHVLPDSNIARDMVIKMDKSTWYIAQRIPLKELAEYASRPLQS